MPQIASTDPLRLQDVVASIPIEDRPAMRNWIEGLDARRGVTALAA